MPQNTTSDELWTTRRLLAWTSAHFKSKKLDRPRLSAEMLIAHVLGVERLKLYMDQDRPASHQERLLLRTLVKRASRYEPIDYLVGEAPFFSLMLKVDPTVLIPRPSTETLVEYVLQQVRCTPGLKAPRILDVGTGSGAIAIAIAKHLPKARIMATDVSYEAIRVARTNARRHMVLDRIWFVQTNLLESWTDPHFDFLISNPPYISDVEWLQVATNIKDFEPHAALRGGLDGLRFIRPLIEQAGRYLDRPGQLVIEIASSQKDRVLELVTNATDFANAYILDDHEALPRVLVANAR